MEYMPARPFNERLLRRRGFCYVESLVVYLALYFLAALFLDEVTFLCGFDRHAVIEGQRLRGAYSVGLRRWVRRQGRQ